MQWIDSHGDFCDDDVHPSRMYVGRAGYALTDDSEREKWAERKRRQRAGLVKHLTMADLGNLPERVRRLHAMGVLYTDVDRRAHLSDKLGTAQRIAGMRKDGARAKTDTVRALESAVTEIERELGLRDD